MPRLPEVVVIGSGTRDGDGQIVVHASLLLTERKRKAMPRPPESEMARLLRRRKKTSKDRTLTVCMQSTIEELRLAALRSEASEARICEGEKM